MSISSARVAGLPVEVAIALTGMLGSLSRYTMNPDGSVSVTCLKWSARIRVSRSRTKLVLEAGNNLALDIPLEVPLVEDGVSVCADILRHYVPTLLGGEAVAALRDRAGLMGAPVLIEQLGLGQAKMTSARGQVTVSHSQGYLTYEPRGGRARRIALPMTATMASSIADDVVQVLSGSAAEAPA